MPTLKTWGFIYLGLFVLGVFIFFLRDAYRTFVPDKKMLAAQEWRKIEKKIKDCRRKNPELPINHSEAEDLKAEEMSAWNQYCKYHSYHRQDELRHISLQSIMKIRFD